MFWPNFRPPTSRTNRPEVVLIQETGSFEKVKLVFTIIGIISEICSGDEIGITKDEFTSETDFLPSNFPAIYNFFQWTDSRCNHPPSESKICKIFKILNFRHFLKWHIWFKFGITKDILTYVFTSRMKIHAFFKQLYHYFITWIRCWFSICLGEGQSTADLEPRSSHDRRIYERSLTFDLRVQCCIIKDQGSHDRSDDTILQITW